MAKIGHRNKRKRVSMERWGKEGWGSFLKVFGVIVLSCVLCVGVPYGVYSWYRHYADSGYFSPKVIEISGNLRVSDAEILEASGLESGLINLVELNTEEVRRSLLNLEWIESVDFKISLPDKISIQIVEKSVLAMVFDGQLMLVDAKGEVIKPWFSGDEMIAPVISGEGISGDSERVLEGMDIARKYTALGLDRYASLYEVHFEAATGFSLYVGGSEVRIGYDRFEERLEGLLKVWSVLSKDNVVADYVLLDSEAHLDEAVVGGLRRSGEVMMVQKLDNVE